MKYILYFPHTIEKIELEINETEFNELKSAKELLHYLGTIEESYDILISNYIEFENEILQFTLKNMVISDHSAFKFYELRMLLNKRLNNLLSSVKLYQDLVCHQIPNRFNNRNSYQHKIKGLFSFEYDNNKYYKFLEELRKYTQHAGLAIHLTRIGSSRIDHENSFLLEHKIDFSSYFKNLEKDQMFNKNKFSEFENEIDLKEALRHYIQSISSVHVSIRKLFDNHANNYRNIIESAHSKIAEKFNCNTDYLKAACISEQNEIDEIALLLDWDNIRIKLGRKNKLLNNLSKQYISNSSKK